MTAAPRVRRFVCPRPGCGRQHVTWAHRCATCGTMNLVAADVDLETAPPSPSSPPYLSIVPDAPDDGEDAGPDPRDRSGPILLEDVEADEHEHHETGVEAFDAVLGGGLVVGSVVLIAAPPGAGKSTLLMQALSGLGWRSLYATGEETTEQLAATARRIGISLKKIYVAAERDVGKIFDYARRARARVVVVDSLQKMVCADLEGRAGSPAQVKECLSRLYRFAKDTGVTVVAISQVTNEDRVAGGRALEHDCDVVLELEVRPDEIRVIRPVGKNRFGSTSVEGKLRMTAKGLVAVDGDGWDEPL